MNISSLLYFVLEATNKPLLLARKSQLIESILAACRTFQRGGGEKKSGFYDN